MDKEPLPEYQARSTGPVAKPAKERSIAELPICLQSAVSGAELWAWVAMVLSTVAISIRVVALLNTDPHHCILFDRSSASETVDSSRPWSISHSRAGTCTAILVLDCLEQGR